MVNPDSDLARAHPDWMLATDGYEPVVGRHQLVLDLGRPEAFAHVLGQLDGLLADHDIAFVKWDMNRAHAQASGAHGAAGTHRQTLALYALLDVLRERHPAVEFESCASGGGRVDHEILRRTERVWTSDCNDALERQQIQRGASMLIPPELMGAHIGPSRSHTTGRIHSLAFRGATAMFGHLGVEWNISRLDDDRNEPTWPGSSRSTRSTASCCTPVTSCASTPRPTPASPTACTPPIGRPGSCPSSSSRRRRASPRRRYGCPASTRTSATRSPTCRCPANAGAWRSRSRRGSPAAWC